MLHGSLIHEIVQLWQQLGRLWNVEKLSQGFPVDTADRHAILLRSCRNGSPELSFDPYRHNLQGLRTHRRAPPSASAKHLNVVFGFLDIDGNALYLIIGEHPPGLRLVCLPIGHCCSSPFASSKSVKYAGLRVMAWITSRSPSLNSSQITSSMLPEGSGPIARTWEGLPQGPSQRRPWHCQEHEESLDRCIHASALTCGSPHSIIVLRKNWISTAVMTRWFQVHIYQE